MKGRSRKAERNTKSKQRRDRQTNGDEETEVWIETKTEQEDREIAKT